MNSRVEPDQRLPKDLRQIYGSLAGSLIDVNQLFAELDYLFASADNVALLNETAPAFFLRYQHLLFTSLFAAISRFTDNRTSGSGATRQQNLTLDRLFSGLDPSKHSQLRKTLTQKWQAIYTISEPIRLYRHKRIAHADLVEYLTPSTALVQGITFGLCRTILCDISDYLNTFDSAFTGVASTYCGQAEYGDSADLIAILRKSVKRS